MQSAHDVKLGYGLRIAGSRGLKRFLKCHGVSARRIFFSPKRTQPACCHAYIRRINVAVDVEVSLIAVHPLPNVVCHPTNGEDVTAAVKDERIIGAQPLASKNLLVDRLEPQVVGLKWMRAWHCIDNTAGRAKEAQVRVGPYDSGQWALVLLCIELCPTH